MLIVQVIELFVTFIDDHLEKFDHC